jgi:hypothetical protein
MAGHQSVQPGLRASPEPQAPGAVGQCVRGAAQDAQALLFQFVRQAVVRSQRGRAGWLVCVQVRSHVVLRRAGSAAILKGSDDALASNGLQFYDMCRDRKTTLDWST